jgi:hypothetical protein
LEGKIFCKRWRKCTVNGWSIEFKVLDKLKRIARLEIFLTIIGGKQDKDWIAFLKVKWTRK